ncbi:MAG TPA: DUF742 domain-containing protein [Actinospica sp.]|nr:DUF742 domain-containing protein [Actinospica sp.]
MIRRATPPPADGPQEFGPERIYVLTGGRGGPNARTRLDLVTLVVTVGSSWQRPAAAQRRLFPEHRAIIRYCRRPLSVVELSAYLRLPFSATAVLVEDLMQAELVRTRAAVIPAVPDPELIEEVLRGLQRL